MTEVERYRQFIADVAICGDSTGKLARRVLDGMTLAEAAADLAETLARQREYSRRAQGRQQ